MIEWPNFLPAPLIDSFSANPMDNVIRTEMEQGAPKQRLRFTTTPLRMSVVWRMSAQQYRLFVAWFKFEAHYGTEWTNMSINSTNGLTKYRVRFAGTFSASQISHEAWDVSAVVEAADMPSLTEAEYQNEITGTQIGASAQAFHTLIHTTLPNTLGA